MRLGLREALLALAVWLWPAVSPACAVCFSATENNRVAFIVTTFFLTVLPLTMIGGGVLWVRRRMAALDAEFPQAS